MTNLPKQVADAYRAWALSLPSPPNKRQALNWLWTHLLEAAPDKPKVLYAVWESATLDDDDSVDDNGPCSGAISTHSGGNLHWDDHEFEVVYKSAYDQLAAQIVALQHELKRERQAADVMREALNKVTIQAGPDSKGRTKRSWSNDVLSTAFDALAKADAIRRGDL